MRCVRGLFPVLLAGCVTTSEEGRRVPVYATPDDVPCAFETGDVLRPQGRVDLSSSLDYGIVQREALGRAGAEAGAHAVLLVPPPPGTARIRTRGPRQRVVSITFEGWALRFTDAACAAEPG